MHPIAVGCPGVARRTAGPRLSGPRGVSPAMPRTAPCRGPLCATRAAAFSEADLRLGESGDDPSPSPHSWDDSDGSARFGRETGLINRIARRISLAVHAVASFAVARAVAARVAASNARDAILSTLLGVAGAFSSFGMRVARRVSYAIRRALEALFGPSPDAIDRHARPRYAELLPPGSSADPRFADRFQSSLQDPFAPLDELRHRERFGRVAADPELLVFREQMARDLDLARALLRDQQMAVRHEQMRADAAKSQATEEVQRMEQELIWSLARLENAESESARLAEQTERLAREKDLALAQMRAQMAALEELRARAEERASSALRDMEKRYRGGGAKAVGGSEQREALEALQAEAERIRYEKDALAARMAMAERTSAQLTATLEAERERLQRDLTASNTRCDSLRKQVEHAKGMVLEARVRNKELETEIVQVNETGVALRRELEAARAKERALMEEVATLRARSREQDGQLRVAKAEMAQEKRGLMERIRELKENNGELAQREQAAREEALELRGRVGVLETSLGDATALIQALSEQMRDIEKEMLGMMSDAERLFRRATGLHRTGNGAGKGEADGVRELTMAISEEVQEARWPTPRRLPLMKRASG